MTTFTFSQSSTDDEAIELGIDDHRKYHRENGQREGAVTLV